MINLSIASGIAFSIAALEARMLKSENIDTEHLFLGLCKIEDILVVGPDIIEGISEDDWEMVKEEIHDFMELLTNIELDAKIARRRMRKILYESQNEKRPFSGHRSPHCREVFNNAENYCKYSGEELLCLNHLLIAVLEYRSPELNLLYSSLSFDKDNLLKDPGVAAAIENEEGHENVVMTAYGTGDNKVKKPLITKKIKTPFLDKFGRDITRLAKEGKLDPVIGRKEELKKIALILAQKKKNNPILVGDAGVGKTCIIEGLAQKSNEPDAPLSIRNLRIVELTMGSLIAGTKYRGEFEQRLERLIKEASSDSNIVIFIDEIHTMVGAGASGNGGLDAGNILKPALARSEIKCIGATTTAEYRKYIEKNLALGRRFQMIWVDEPTGEETIEILKGLRKKYEEYHKLIIPDEVIEKAVELSMRYIADFRLPDKAIEIIDQACAHKVLKTISPDETQKDEITEICVDDVVTVVSEKCRIPIESLAVEETKRLLKMEEYLQRRVIGQERAIKEITETIRSAKAGLKDPVKPVGVFLFLGSTGTGKTELAKAIAEFLFHDEKHLITFDMSEYQEKQSVAKLIGAPPGYIGYDEEGQLTGKVRTNPCSVILFDEIEKAHHDIFDLFLQIFDEGRLTDAHGRRIVFSEAVIILTSNLGSSHISLKKQIGVDVEEKKSEKGGAYEEHIHQAIARAFRPEFINRIRKKIILSPLSRETVAHIVENILKDFNRLLALKDIQIVLSDDAKEFIIDKGYNEAYGAREMQRTFEQYISEPLSQMILKEEAKSGQLVNISATSTKLLFTII